MNTPLLDNDMLEKIFLTQLDIQKEQAAIMRLIVQNVLVDRMVAHKNIVESVPVQNEHRVKQTTPKRKGVQNKRSKSAVNERIEHAFQKGGYVSVRDLAKRSKCSIGSVQNWVTEQHPELKGGNQ